MTDFHYSGQGRDDGDVLGRSGGKVGFYGATPVAQAATIADVATSTITTAVTTTTGNCWGFATSTQGDDALAILADVRTKLNTLFDDLSDIGIHAAS